MWQVSSLLPERLRRRGRLSSTSTTASNDEETTRLVTTSGPAIPSYSGAESTVASENQQEQPAQPQEQDQPRDQLTNEQNIAVLTRRLRILFTVITWPIVPLGAIVSLSLVWFLYTAFFQDIDHECTNSGLYGYAVMSLLLLAYAPNHSRVRQFVFRNYVRERDGPIRPSNVRRYDQCFHTLAILYVYGGITLVQACREDTHHYYANENTMLNNQTGSTPEQLSWVANNNACAATCPHLYQALSLYVTSLELFTFSLILPLLCLPCIYLWFLRQATADAEALSILQEHLREEADVFRIGNVPVEEITEQLQEVKLVRVNRSTNNQGNSSDGDVVVVVPKGSEDLLEAKKANGALECCICMSDFKIYSSNSFRTVDVESATGPCVFDDGGFDSSNEGEIEGEDRVIVQTKNCGHLFHKRCIGSWIGGQWQSRRRVRTSRTVVRADSNNSESIFDRTSNLNVNEPPSPSTSPSREGSFSSTRTRMARRTTCPLCRKDLRQGENLRS